MCAGIDTHQNTNHVAIINEVGKKLDDREFPTTSYQALLTSILSFGTLLTVGIEGTADDVSADEPDHMSPLTNRVPSAETRRQDEKPGAKM